MHKINGTMTGVAIFCVGLASRCRHAAQSRRLKMWHGSAATTLQLVRTKYNPLTIIRAWVISMPTENRSYVAKDGEARVRI